MVVVAVASGVFVLEAGDLLLLFLPLEAAEEAGTDAGDNCGKGVAFVGDSFGGKSSSGSTDQDADGDRGVVFSLVFGRGRGVGPRPRPTGLVTGMLLLLLLPLLLLPLLPERPDGRIGVVGVCCSPFSRNRRPPLGLLGLPGLLLEPLSGLPSKRWATGEDLAVSAGSRSTCGGGATA